VEAARVRRPHAVHPGPPNRIEVRTQRLQIVPHQRALPQVRGAGPSFEVLHQPRQGSGAEQHVRIHAQHELRVGLTKEQVTDPVAVSSLVGDVAVPGDLVLQVFQCLGTGAARVVVHDDDLGAVGHLGMIEADGLDGEVHPIVVVVRGHADAQESARSTGRGRQEAAPVPDQAVVQERGCVLVERRGSVDLPQNLEQGLLGQYPVLTGITRALTRGQLSPLWQGNYPTGRRSKARRGGRECRRVKPRQSQPETRSRLSRSGLPFTRSSWSGAR
jgi:hypothetical protein